ncbi:hypothetical protein [Deinococcus multiflagellatus]|uniref:Uncharacterized protein n=1 Tax=Deinococcus multiflagellatus TaxID=1656887 RepID=A0ABW1ZQG8_9DEIO|nr:hypothetical protein [Deinococcus multiflagellatus]
MANYRKNTKKKPRKPLTPTEIAVIITATSGFLGSIAALINALK